jgi:hypothetical protein
MRRILPIVVALGIILGAGVVQGVWAQRWGAPFDYEKISATLSDVPQTLGEWDSEDHEIDQVSLQVGRIDAYLSRIYRNRNTGEAVGVMLVCGQPGPISLHPPTICFTAAGAVQVTPVTTHQFTYSPAGDEFEYLTTDFTNDIDGQTQETRVLWSWKGSGAWQAPSVPRWTFGSEPLLVKLYITRAALKLEPLEEGQAVNESTGELLERLLPELDRVMKVLPNLRIAS